MISKTPLRFARRESYFDVNKKWCPKEIVAHDNIYDILGLICSLFDLAE